MNTLCFDENNTDCVIVTSMKSELLTQFGKRLQALRLKKGWSRATLAQECSWGEDGDSRKGSSRIAHYENGTREPKMAHVEVLAKVLGIPTVELHYGIADKSIPLITPSELTTLLKSNKSINISGLDWPTLIKYTSPENQPSDKAFAVSIESDNYMPRFINGEKIIIDPSSDIKESDIGLFFDTKKNLLLLKKYDGKDLVSFGANCEPPQKLTDWMNPVGKVVESFKKL